MMQQALHAERATALAIPAARILLAGSVVMAIMSGSANLAALGDLSSETTLRTALHGSTVATLIFSLLGGVFMSTTDHRFGMVDHRLLSVPGRSVYVRARALAAATTGLLYGLGGAIAAVVGIGGYYVVSGVSFDLGSAVVVRALLGIVLATPLFGLLGAAVGMVVRNQPIAIGGALAWVLMVEPIFILGVPEVGAWLPGAAALALTYSPDPSLLSQVGGGMLLLGYAVVATAIAQRAFARSDV